MSKQEIREFLKQYGTRTDETPDGDAEIWMDDHTCIEWSGVEYYVKENNIFYTERDYEILDHLNENFHV